MGSMRIFAHQLHLFHRPRCWCTRTRIRTPKPPGPSNASRKPGRCCPTRRNDGTTIRTRAEQPMSMRYRYYIHNIYIYIYITIYIYIYTLWYILVCNYIYINMHHFNFRIPSPQELQEGDASDEVPMSPDEAFAAFAFAAACASGGGFGDMAESLFWAQHLGHW